MGTTVKYKERKLLDKGLEAACREKHGFDRIVKGKKVFRQRPRSGTP